MRIGIDFDNTIACYDGIFHAEAVRRNLIPAAVADDKTSVRDYLRANGMEQDWILLQGHVYGGCMGQVPCFEGVQHFVRSSLRAGHHVAIISHKTRRPNMRTPYDLRQAARDFLDRHGVFASDGIVLPENNVFFESTCDEKFGRIASEKCDVFVDDLPEFLIHPGFPSNVDRILFDPANVYADDRAYLRTASWDAIDASLTHRATHADR